MMSAADREAEARRLIALAEEHEDKHELKAAVECYKRAYKLAPQLDRHGDFGEDVEVLRAPPADFDFRVFDAADPALFDTASPQYARLLDYFDKFGFVVVNNVLSADEVTTAMERFQSFMMQVGVDVTSKKSLETYFSDPAYGLVAKAGCGSSNLNWFVRSRERVKNLFRLVHKLPVVMAGGTTTGVPAESKLITSLDGFNYFRNPEAGDDLWGGLTAPWLHFDAACAAHGNYVQSLVNLIDCTQPEDPGFVCLPRSHETLFRHIVPAEVPAGHRSYLTMLDRAERKVMNDLNLEEKCFRVPMAPGSMVLWRSSLLHCNTGCTKRPPPLGNPAQLLRRVAVYVCMMPDPHDSEVTTRRRDAFSRGQTTTHQPDLVRCVYGGEGQPADIASGVVIADEANLPPGAAELL